MARQVLENGVILPAEYSDDWYDDMTSNLTKLDDVIGSDSEKLSSADVGAAALSNNYNDLDNLPTIPTVNDATLTIQKNGVDVQTFTANASSNVTCNITVPTKTSDLTNDSNFVDTSNSAVSSGITSAKVTDYDTHIADTDIHVTTADKTSWNTVTSKANDSDVVHKSGDETIAGVKTFSDDTYITSLNFTNNVASPSSSASSTMPIINTITYTSGDTSVVARLNFRITADGVKSLYPNENNQYLLGLQSRKWKEIHATEYYYGSSDVEFSQKFVTTDTAQTISGNKTFSDNISTKKIISNVAQLQINAKSNADSVAVIAGADTSEGGGLWVYGKDSANGSDCRMQIYNTTKSRYERVDLVGSQFLPTPSGELDCGGTLNKWKSINGINPGALSMPSGNTSDMIDISSYITLFDGTNNGYTPPADGWICISGKNCTAIYVYRNNYWGVNSFSPTADNILVAVPVVAGVTFAIKVIGQGLNYAKFVPCQGNV